MLNRDEFDILVSEVKDAAQKYYDGAGIQLKTDAEYDAMVDMVENCVAANPTWDANGVLDMVAAGASGGGDVAHSTPMLSLAKSKTFPKIIEFLSTLSTNVVVEPKIDGLAVRAEYHSGRLTLVATRGDGLTGENVTAQAYNVSGLPATIVSNGFVEVRGEVYMTDADFEIANTNRVASGRLGFANPRNATAGSLRREDNNYITPMSFAAYDIVGDGFAQNSYQERMRAATILGFGTTLQLFDTLDIPNNLTRDNTKVLERIEMLETARPTLGFPIDGAVIKVDSFASRETLGTSSRTPRWATSYKYAADTTTTVVTGIEMSIGRTGRLGLRLVVEPVSVGGTLITYAAGHNVSWMESQHMGVGTKVTLYRAGDVIPRAIALPAEQQPATATVWVPPAVCPQCGGDWDKSSLLWRCLNPEDSVVGWLVYACSRDLLDIEGASDAFVTSVVEAGLANDPADLYDLTVDQIANLVLGETNIGNERKIGVTNAKKIFVSIREAKNATLDRHINSLNLRKTGRTMSRRLAAHFRTMNSFRNATVEQLIQVDGIGLDKAETIHKGLQTRSNLIDRMVAAGVTTTILDVEESSAKVNTLVGEKVVVTGSMSSEPRLATYNRNAVNELVEAQGGKSSGSVSSSTTLLVCGDPDSSKYVKAVSLGVPIVSPTEFADRVGL